VRQRMILREPLLREILHRESLRFRSAPLPPRGREDKRLTPAEVRAYWKAADEALHATFNGTLPEGVRKESTITLSWAVHITGMERFDWYRDMIREEYHLHQLPPRTGPPI